MDRLLAGRYRLQGLLGRGAMAEVNAATDERLGRPVAIKLMPVDRITPEERRRFVREARAIAGFSHPNVVTLYDAGEADGFLYLVMERVAGTTLAARIAVEPLDAATATALTTELLSALDAAHRSGIVHRDVKPSNVLVDDDGHAKLVDFGIALRFDELAGDLTGTGQHIGTPKYMAPEIISGGPPTPASDVYAVGVMLYEMLTGRPPFDAGTPIATAMAHVNTPAPDVLSVAPATPPAVAAVVARALAKDPSRRFSSAGEMRSALASSSAGPVARPLPPTEVMTAGPVRMRGARWWLLAVVLAVVSGVIATIAVLNGGDEPSTGSATTAGQTAPSSAAPPTSTTAAPTTAVATTAVATTVTVAVAADPTVGPGGPAPGDVDALVAVLAADPERYGSRTNDVVDRLGDLGNGRKATDRAAALLESAEQWVAEGQLDAEALDMLRTVLAPIADGPGNGNGNSR